MCFDISKMYYDFEVSLVNDYLDIKIISKGNLLITSYDIGH